MWRRHKGRFGPKSWPNKECDGVTFWILGHRSNLIRYVIRDEAELLCHENDSILGASFLFQKHSACSPLCIWFDFWIRAQCARAEFTMRCAMFIRILPPVGMCAPCIWCSTSCEHNFGEHWLLPGWAVNQCFLLAWDEISVRSPRNLLLFYI